MKTPTPIQKLKTLKYIKISLALIFILFSSFCCLDLSENYSLQPVVVVNQTDEDIMTFSLTDVYQNIMTENLETIYFYRRNSIKILPANSATQLDTPFLLDDKGIPSHNEMLLVMIIRRSTLDKYPLGYLIENNIYDDKYLLSYDELKLTNFEIIYDNRDEE